MSTTEKVRLVETVDDQYDLSMALSAVHLPKSTWYYHQNQKQDYQEKDEHLHPKLEEIACEHPEYGIPRITKELQGAYQIVINHKVVYADGAEKAHSLVILGHTCKMVFGWGG
jgi:hypothetical protein